MRAPPTSSAILLASLALIAGIVAAPARAAGDPATEPPFGGVRPPELVPAAGRTSSRPDSRSPRTRRSARRQPPAIRDELAESPDAEPRGLRARRRLAGRVRRRAARSSPSRSSTGAAARSTRPGATPRSGRRLPAATPGAVAQAVNSPWIWIPLSLLFIAPFFDPRRPWRLVHLDLLVILGLGLSLFFFNRAEITASVALYYPVLGYLLVRMLLAGLRPREREGPLVPFAPASWLAAGIVVLVVAPDRPQHRRLAGDRHRRRRRDRRRPDRRRRRALRRRVLAGIDLRGDVYGPANYLAYLPFELHLRLGRGLGRRPRGARGVDRVRPPLRRRASHSRSPAAHRRRRAGARLGARVRMGRLPVDALHDERERQRRARRRARDRRVARRREAGGPRRAHRRSQRRRNSALRHWRRYSRSAPASAAGAEPHCSRPRSRSSPSPPSCRSSPTAASASSTTAPLATRRPEARRSASGARPRRSSGPSGSSASRWSRSRSAPPSIRGRRRRSQLAALAAAVTIALQLTATHWFYFYVVWFLPFALVASFSELREVSRGDRARSR